MTAFLLSNSHKSLLPLTGGEDARRVDEGATAGLCETAVACRAVRLPYARPRPSG